jgi:hypothetical protein
MTWSLHANSVKAACEKHWFANRSECNQFVSAVAKEMLAIIPGDEREADLMVRTMNEPWWTDSSGVHFLIPRGHHAAAKAIEFANYGYFVIAGMSAEDINLAHSWHAPMPLQRHGHVAVVTPGVGKNGWPRGYWGQHGGVGRKDESLSETFPHRRPELVYYFCTKVDGA